MRVIHRLHRLENGGYANRILGMEPPKRLGVRASVARRVESLAVLDHAIVETQPVDLVGAAEAAQQAVQRSARIGAGKVMRPRIEAENARLAAMAEFSQPGMAEAAGQHMLLEELDLQSGRGEQGCGGQAANPGADDDDIDLACRTRRVETRRRPVETVCA